MVRLSVLLALLFLFSSSNAAEATFCSESRCSSKLFDGPGLEDIQEFLFFATIAQAIFNNSQVCKGQEGSDSGFMDIEVAEDERWVGMQYSDLLKPSGHGAWTQLGYLNMSIYEANGKNQLYLRAGRQKNGSKHAKWKGTYTVSFTNNSGDIISIHIMDVTKKRRNVKRNFRHRKQTKLPPNFWDFVRQPGLKAKISVHATRQC